MEFEVLKRNIIIGIIIIGVVSACIFYFSKERYYETKSIPFVNGEVKNQDNLLGVYIKTDNGYERVEQIPSEGYILNESESYCEINDTKDNTITLEYQDGKVNFLGLTKKGTKCYLYFDEYQAKDIILANNPTVSDARDGAITGALTTNTTGTIYTKQDDDGTSYFFAGNINNNWVHFAGYYWRIIRINGDGSIRMIYNGTSTSGTGKGTQIQTSAYNSSYNDNAYVGYMYGSTEASSYSETHANTTNSTIKGILDNWYRDHIENTEYENSISTEAGFCNDRKVASSNETWWADDTKRGYGTNKTAYAPYSRFLTTRNSWAFTQTPTLNCSQSNDLFTTSESSKGNKKLTYPIGLITADEVVLAGGFGGSNNTSYYLYTGQHYWTMSPRYFNGYYAYVFAVHSDGSLDYWNVNSGSGVRPVINLKADVSFTGEGTASNPYEVA